MNNIYDVIDALRVQKHLSVRCLGNLAGIPPSTLASIMERRPKKITIKNLKGIATALNVRWNDLANIPDTELMRYEHIKSIPSDIDPDVAEAIVNSFMVVNTPQLLTNMKSDLKIVGTFYLKNGAVIEEEVVFDKDNDETEVKNFIKNTKDSIKEGLQSDAEFYVSFGYTVFRGKDIAAVTFKEV